MFEHNTILAAIITGMIVSVVRLSTTVIRLHRMIEVVEIHSNDNTHKNKLTNRVYIKKRSPADFNPEDWANICKRIELKSKSSINLEALHL